MTPPEDRERAVCSECGEELPELAIVHGDRYCSSRCAKVAYGVPLRGTSISTVLSPGESSRTAA